MMDFQFRASEGVLSGILDVGLSAWHALRRDCEYQRGGSANGFGGVEPKAGRHFTKATANRTSPQFADYLVEIVAAYPEADNIHLMI